MHKEKTNWLTVATHRHHHTVPRAEYVEVLFRLDKTRNCAVFFCKLLRASNLFRMKVLWLLAGRTFID